MLPGEVPCLDNLPVVGFIPCIPQLWDGLFQNEYNTNTLKLVTYTLIEPPKSDPIPSGDPPAAMIAPSPPELPPGDLDKSNGFLVLP